MTQTVTVLGAGTMGHGIALVAAQAGHRTRLYDLEQVLVDEGLERIEDALDTGIEKRKTTRKDKQATLSNLSGTTELADATEGADVVIEAIPEDLALKRDTFTQVEQLVGQDALLATNTSSLSIEAIAKPLARPERFVGLHFFNPPYIRALDEVNHRPDTSAYALEPAVAFADDLGKTPIEVRDAPGFASSRLGLALGLEAIRMVEQDVASPEDIDTAMTLGYNHPMGPLELTDLIGLDVRLDIAEYLAEELGDRFEPPELLREMVDDGKLGEKAGEGFYEYEG